MRKTKSTRRQVWTPAYYISNMVWVPVVLFLSLVTVVLGWLALLWRLVAHRKEFEIAARSPSLVLMTEVTCLILVASVLLNWLLQSMGAATLPCPVTFIISYGVLQFSTMPYFVRAVRLVIAYNRKYRLKYAKFVKRKRATGVLVLTSIGLTIRAGLFFGDDPAHYSSDMRECFYFDDVMLGGAVLIVAGGPLSILVIRISRVNDAFKLREELCCSMIGGSTIATTHFVLQVLLELDVLSNTPALHVVVEVLSLLFGINAGVWGLLLPMARAHRGGVQEWFRATVVPVEEVFTVQASDECGVLRLASGGGELAQQFGKFCRENLCMESWDFLVDVVRYERIAPSLIANHPEDEQFNSFLFILNQYLLPTSPDEINISSSMSKRILAFGTREAFNELSLEERVGILKELFDEIVRMLEQNLLNKFQRRVALDREAQLLTAADGDVDLVTVMKASDHRVCSSKPEISVSGYNFG